jgi:uncharacterized protein YndB with AHSA1/START domain
MIEIVMDGPVWLVLRMRLAGIEPAAALRWFSDATLLNRWWGEDALIEPRPGGLYEVHWPAMGWTMRGEVALCTAETLAYSWAWDHEPEGPPRMVIVHGEADGDGTIVTVTHGPYQMAAPGEEEDRLGHREGWLSFLPDLRTEIEATRPVPEQAGGER